MRLGSRFNVEPRKKEGPRMSPGVPHSGDSAFLCFQLVIFLCDVCVRAGMACYDTHVEVRGKLSRLLLSFNHVDADLSCFCHTVDSRLAGPPA